MKGDGRIYQRGARWWIEYWVRGKQFRESGGATKKEAERSLRARLKQIYGGRFVEPNDEKLMVDELLKNLTVHLETKGARSSRAYGYHLNPVREFFSLTRAVDVTTSLVEEFIQARRKKGKKNATINRETGALKQALNLARKQERLARVAYIPMLKEDNARQGFFERAEFEAVVARLPPPIADIARFAYLSGWRRGEILPLKWDAVDRSAREVRLRTSKNGRPRTLPLEGELWELIERRWQARQFSTWDGMSHVSEHIFHRYGRPWVDVTKPWKDACEQAGVKGRLFHDLRRTAVRNMVRAGVPQAVAMSISGHRTVSMFIRYNIASEDDKREALKRTQAHVATQSVERNVVQMSQEGSTR